MTSRSDYRTTEQRVLLVSSRDGLAGGTSAAFTIELPEAWNVQEFVLISAAIPSRYNVTAENNSLVTSLGACTIGAGSYSGTALATALQAALAVFDATATATYTVSGQNAGRFTVAAATPFSINFASSPSSLRQTLGFSAANLTGANAYTSQGFASLGLPEVHVASVALTGGGSGVLAPAAAGVDPRTFIQKIATTAEFSGVTVFDTVLASERAHILPERGVNVKQWDFSFWQRSANGDSTAFVACDFGGADVSLELLVSVRRHLL